MIFQGGMRAPSPDLEDRSLHLGFVEDAGEIASPFAVVLIEPALGGSFAEIERFLERGEVDGLVVAVMELGATAEAVAGQIDHEPRDIGNRAVTERGVDRGAWHFVAQRLALLVGPVRHQIPGAVERFAVVEQAGPDGGEGQDLVAIAHIGATHFEKLLQPHFGEQGREMVLPILERRLFTGQLRELAIEESPEILARDVDILVVADDEVHRHRQRVVGILLEPEALIERKGEHAGAGPIGVEPDVRAEAQILGGLAVDEGRIGAERRDNRLQRH